MGPVSPVWIGHDPIVGAKLQTRAYHTARDQPSDVRAPHRRHCHLLAIPIAIPISTVPAPRLIRAEGLRLRYGQCNSYPNRKNVVTSVEVCLNTHPLKFARHLNDEEHLLDAFPDGARLQ